MSTEIAEKFQKFCKNRDKEYVNKIRKEKSERKAAVTNKIKESRENDNLVELRNTVVKIMVEGRLQIWLNIIK